MKNKKFLTLSFLIFFNSFNYLFCQDINIKAEKIKIDEKKTGMQNPYETMNFTISAIFHFEY